MRFCPPEDLSFPEVYYFYLPANEDKPAEIIEVLHGDSLYIQVPLRDEDMQLTSFYQRPITTKEILKFGVQQIWQIFTSWQELEDDHLKWNIPEQVILELRKHKADLSISNTVPA